VIDFKQFLRRIEFQPYRAHFATALARRTEPKRHGDLASWLEILEHLPDIKASKIQLNQDIVRIGNRTDLSTQQYADLERGLRALSPWRKGPYELFGVFINTEWRSDWKWQRVAPHIRDLRGKCVLDVGCGTGYHCWRMLGAGASYVMGIDPSMRFLIQHAAINKYINACNFDFLPIGIEDMPTDMAIFDSVFSMGVLYHRRNPVNHLIELFNLITNGGELILETLIIDHAETDVLRPEGRYAQMRNVWSLLTVDKTLSLLQQAGFESARCVDQNVTSLEEQRQTDWMQFHSLAEFLDPDNPKKTIEGYPAPKRGIFIAQKPA